jgi:hypothetical protein
MTQWLRYLREKVYPTGPLLLIMDTYSAHRCEQTKSVARELEIDLEFIPPGCTDRLQPCDRRLFGVLKAKARKYWRWRHRCFGTAKTTHADMMEILVKCWKEITQDAVTRAWEIYDLADESWESDDDEEDPSDETYEISDFDGDDE